MVSCRPPTKFMTLLQQNNFNRCFRAICFCFDLQYLVGATRCLTMQHLAHTQTLLQSKVSRDLETVSIASKSPESGNEVACGSTRAVCRLTNRARGSCYRCSFVKIESILGSGFGSSAAHDTRTRLCPFSDRKTAEFQTNCSELHAGAFLRLRLS